MANPKLDFFRKQLTKQKLDGVLISSVANITYLTGFSNFTLEERGGFVLITKDKQFILTSALYAEAVKKQVPEFELVELHRGPIFKKTFKSLSQKHHLKNLGIEENNLTVAESKFFSQFSKLSGFNHHHLRSVKTDSEIAAIKKACQIGDLAFKHILTKIKLGVTEKQLAFELEKFIKSSGATFSFDPIVAFGPNSSVPHHQTGDAKLKNKSGQFVLMDFGVKFDNYCSDMTRTIFFGQPTLRQKRVYNAVFQAQQQSEKYITQCLELGRPIKTALIDQKARDYISSQGFPPFNHSSHGIGLEVHEHPSLSFRSKDILKPGMVFSIEPGIYFEEFGGIRIEDLYLLEQTKLTKLTQASNKLIQL